MPWNYDAPTTSVELGFWLSKLLRFLDDPGWETMIPDHFPDLHRPGNFYDNRPATLEAPRTLKCALFTGDLFLFQGVKNAATAGRLLAEYSRSFGDASSSGINEQVWRAADQLWTQYMSTANETRGNVLLTGHSFGGAVAQVLGLRLKETYPTKGIRVVTFGSPRVGPAPYAVRTRSIDHVRYWNHDDPIPWICPHRSEAPNGHALLTTNISNRWSAYQQTGMGVEIVTHGSMTVRAYPNTPVVNSELNLVGWATGLINAPVQAHSIQEYYVRMGEAERDGVTLGPRPAGAPYRPRPGEGPPPPPPVPTTPPPAVQAAVQQVQAQAIAERAIPSPHVFEAHNLYGAWGVYRGAECVTVAGNRTRAHRLARVGNQMVRDGQARGVDNQAEVAAVLATML